MEPQTSGQLGDLLQVQVDADPPTLTVRFIGELDLSRAELMRLLPPHQVAVDASTVILDLTGLTFCDCSGLRALTHFRAAHVALGRSFSVVGVRPGVRRLMAICGIEDQLTA